MRDLTKSLMSFSWALSLFGLRQMKSILMPQSWNSASDSFDSVTRSTEEQLGSVSDSVFRAGDNLQRGLVDLMFSFFTSGGNGRATHRNASNGNGRRDGGETVRRSVQWGADVIQRSAEAGADALRQTAGMPEVGASANLRQEDVGWGAVPGNR